MRQDYVDITLLLDKSSSMSRLAKDTVAGVNRFVADQKRVPGRATFTLVQFDTAYEFTHQAVPIDYVPLLTSANYRPFGNTALRDAMGRAILETGRRLANMAEHERPARVLFIVVTDGEENASTEVSQADLKRMVEEQTHIWKWEFIYLGANVDAFTEAANIGIQPQYAAAYGANSGGIMAAMAVASSGTMRVRQAAMYGDNSASMSYTNSERQELQETLTPDDQRLQDDVTFTSTTSGSNN